MTARVSDDLVDPSPTKRRWRKTRITVAVILSTILIVGVVSVLTPWPSAMLIRAVFTDGGKKSAEEMAGHVPDTPLTTTLNVSYDGSTSESTMMDVFTPASATGPLPTVVWIHGGAWISGAKEDVDPYLRIIAGEGYTTIGVNYTRGPEGTYPLAVNELNQALAYINEHAAELGVDPTQIVLAGDSAGAQLASQLAALITNDEYASLAGISPALAADQLSATILNCGVYDLAALADIEGLVGWGFKTAMWAYVGDRNWAETNAGKLMSTIDFVTADFPPTYISGGNGDGLTKMQSIPLSEKLDSLGTKPTTLFWPKDHEPALGHEYQFHLDLPDAQTALKATLEFLAAHTTR